MNYDIVVLTEEQYVQPKEKNKYIDNVLLEDQLVIDALKKENFSVIKTNWDNPDMDWSAVKMLIFRTTWDYHHRFDEFKKWLDKVEKTCELINPSSIIFWNIDKHYLADLSAKGIKIIPSTFIEIGEQKSLAEIVAASGYEKIILKPTISAAARETFKISLDEIPSHESNFKKLIAKEAFLIQPFIESIEDEGEVSFMVFGGQYSHAVLKKAKPGDFRVQDDFGGTVHEYLANEQEIAFAERCVKACDPMPLYARVDVVWDHMNEMCLSELELIEPELWFRRCPEAATDLAKHIKTYSDKIYG